MPARTYSDLALYRRLLTEARPHWARIGSLFLLSVLGTPLKLLAPLPLKIAVDSVSGPPGTHPIPSIVDAFLPAGVPRSGTAALVFAAALLVAVTLAVQLQELASAVLRTYTGERLVLGLRTRLFHHVQRLSLSHHDTRGTYDAAYRIQYDAQAPQYIITDGLIPFVAAAFTVVSMLYVTARIDWQLAIIALGITPVLSFISRFFRRRLRRQWEDLKQLESAALAVAQEVLAALRVVKAFGQEEREQQRFERKAIDGVWARVRITFAEGLFSLLVALTAAVGTAAVLLIGIRHVQQGALTLGELMLVMGYLTQLYEPLKTIGRKAASLQSHLASAERVFTLLEAPPDVPERPHARPLARAVGAVTFRNVSFAYGSEGGVQPALDDLSFHVAPGTRLGIAGTTGAGKSTLVSLLTRFYDPDRGQILLDGIDLRDFRVIDLRNQFAIVLQDPVLFSTSIAENIAYARPGAGERKITAAARAAGAHEFIVRLPRGYETQVGERGLRLSGGERQRITLARAFLKDAPILILDEPTSSVDLRTEASIIEALERLMHGRTVFMIAHRLSTLATCDARLHIEHGRLVEPAQRSSMSSAGSTLRGHVSTDR